MHLNSAMILMHRLLCLIACQPTRTRAQLQQAASACTRSNLDDVEAAVLRRCTLLQLEAKLNRLGIQQAAAFTVGGGHCCALLLVFV